MLAILSNETAISLHRTNGPGPSTPLIFKRGPIPIRMRFSQFHQGRTESLILDKRAPFKLGIIGGSLGFLTLLLPAFLSFNPDCSGSPSCSPRPLPFELALPIFLGAAMGIVGGLVWRSHTKAGTTILLAGALIAPPLWMIGYYGIRFGLIDTNGISFVLSSVVLFWWDGLLILAGLIAIPRVRSRLRQLHDAGWIP